MLYRVNRQKSYVCLIVFIRRRMSFSRFLGDQDLILLISENYTNSSNDDKTSGMCAKLYISTELQWRE